MLGPRPLRNAGLSSATFTATTIIDIFIHHHGGTNEKKTIITIITKYEKELT